MACISLNNVITCLISPKGPRTSSKSLFFFIKSDITDFMDVANSAFDYF